MIYGLMLTLCVGCIWLMLGIVMAVARRRNCSPLAFYVVGSALASTGAWLFWRLDHGGFAWPSGSRDILLWTALAAIFNAVGQVLYMRSLGSAACSLAFAIPQIAFIVPFAAAVLIWHETPRLTNILGIGGIAWAILLAATGERQRRYSGPIGRPIFVSTLIALLIGIGQAAAAIPSHLAGGTDGESSSLRPPVMLTVSLLVYLTGWGVMSRGRTRPTADTWVLGGLWGCGALASFTLLFKALDRMSGYGKSGLVFALASSIGIVGFTLFSGVILKENLTLRKLGAIGMIVIGIIIAQF